MTTLPFTRRESGTLIFFQGIEIDVGLEERERVTLDSGADGYRPAEFFPRRW